jgi:hypothetical protein
MYPKRNTGDDGMYKLNELFPENYVAFYENGVLMPLQSTILPSRGGR